MTNIEYVTNGIYKGAHVSTCGGGYSVSADKADNSTLPAEQAPVSQAAPQDVAAENKYWSFTLLGHTFSLPTPKFHAAPKPTPGLAFGCSTTSASCPSFEAAIGELTLPEYPTGRQYFNYGELVTYKLKIDLSCLSEQDIDKGAVKVAFDYGINSVPMEDKEGNGIYSVTLPAGKWMQAKTKATIEYQDIKITKENYGSLLVQEDPCQIDPTPVAWGSIGLDANAYKGIYLGKKIQASLGLNTLLSCDKVRGDDPASKLEVDFYFKGYKVPATKVDGRWQADYTFVDSMLDEGLGNILAIITDPTHTLDGKLNYLVLKQEIQVSSRTSMPLVGISGLERVYYVGDTAKNITCLTDPGVINPAFKWEILGGKTLSDPYGKGNVNFASVDGPVIPTYTFAAEDNVTFRCIVTDEAGATNAKTIDVNIYKNAGQSAPLTGITGQAVYRTKTPVTLTALNSDANIFAYEWRPASGRVVGVDPAPKDPFLGPIFNGTFELPDQYNDIAVFSVELTVYRLSDPTSRTVKSIDLTIIPASFPLPVSKPSVPQSVPVGTPVNLSLPGLDPSFDVAWYPEPNVAPLFGQSVTYGGYNTPGPVTGVYIITSRVNKNYKSSGTFDIYVKGPGEPIVYISASHPVDDNGQNISLDASRCKFPENSPVSINQYIVNWGDGPDETFNFADTPKSHQYSNEGNATAVINVWLIDSNGDKHGPYPITVSLWKKA